LKLIRPGLRNREILLLVGEPYWIDTPPDEAYAAITNGDRDLFTTLAGTQERPYHTNCRRKTCRVPPSEPFGATSAA
jgi:hypothetical protein